MAAEEPLGLAEAAERLGWRGKPKDRARRLLRYLRARERAAQVQIVIDNGAQGNGLRYRVTMRALRRHCRELFVRSADELAAEFRRHLETIDERIDDRIEMLMRPELEELRAVDEEITNQVAALAARLNRSLSAGGISAQESPRVPPPKRRL